GQPRAVPFGDDAAQVGDLDGLGDRRGSHLLEHAVQVGRVRVQERVQRLHRVGAGAHGPTTAMASLACTRIVSPTPAVTSATLTSSRPAPPSFKGTATSAMSSASSRSTVTFTAMSPQVTHWPPEYLWIMRPPPARARPAARRTRAPAPRGCGTS